jgi:hypothetical protein
LHSCRRYVRALVSSISSTFSVSVCTLSCLGCHPSLLLHLDRLIIWARCLTSSRWTPLDSGSFLERNYLSSTQSKNCWVLCFLNFSIVLDFVVLCNGSLETDSLSVDRLLCVGIPWLAPSLVNPG